MSVAFATGARSALGQLQRVGNVAAALRRRRPDVPLDLVTNSARGRDWAQRTTTYRSIEVVDRRGIARQLAAMQPRTVVVGSMVVPGVEDIEAPLCLILREVVRSELPNFRLPGGRPWDLIVVPNPTSGWLPGDAVPARRVEAVGWIYRRPEPPDSHEVRPALSSDGRPTILVTSGGGTADEERDALSEQIARLIAGARAETRTSVAVVQARGPFVPKEWMIPGVDATIDAGSDLHNLFGRASLVISTAGYNSVLELACTDVPVLLVPIGRYTDDQFARAREWGTRLGRCYDPAGEAEAIRWMVSIIDGGLRRPVLDLGPSGADTSAALIAGLLS